MNIFYRPRSHPQTRRPLPLIAPDHPGFGYSSNPPQFPVWQHYLRTFRSPMLVVWGKNDPFFTPAGAEAIARDNPNTSVMLVDGERFALEEYGVEIAAEMHALADRVAAGTYRA